MSACKQTLRFFSLKTRRGERSLHWCGAEAWLWRKRTPWLLSQGFTKKPWHGERSRFSVGVNPWLWRKRTLGF